MKRTVDPKAFSSDGARTDVERRAEVRARREAIAASATWAVPMQVAAIVVTGALIVYSAIAHRWMAWDWLFVGLFVFYVVNAISYSVLTRRRLP